MSFEDLRDALEAFLQTRNGRGQPKNVVDGLHAIASAINANAQSGEEIAKSNYEIARALREERRNS